MATQVNFNKKEYPKLLYRTSGAVNTEPVLGAIVQTYGDTVVEGDVPSHSCIEVSHGNLHIKGNVGDNVSVAARNAPFSDFLLRSSYLNLRHNFRVAKHKLVEVFHKSGEDVFFVPRQLVVEGNIGDNFKAHLTGDAIFKGNIADNAKIIAIGADMQSAGAGFSFQGRGAVKSITFKHIAEKAHLTCSGRGQLIGGTIGENSKIFMGCVDIDALGAGSKFTSSHDSMDKKIAVRSLGANCTIVGQGDATFETVNQNCKITVLGSLKADRIDSGGVIHTVYGVIGTMHPSVQVFRTSELIVMRESSDVHDSLGRINLVYKPYDMT